MPERPEDNQEEDQLSPEPESAYGEEQDIPAEAYGTGDNVADARIEALQKELDAAKDQMLRAVAEAENTRKRLLREREDVRKYAVSDFAKDMLEFADNFGRALASIPSDALQDELVKNVVTGVEAMEKELQKAMEKHGIRKTEPMDEPFDPNFHEALFEAPGTGKPAGTIVELIEPGYVLQDRLLRPAKVGIAKDEGQGPAASDDPGSKIDTEI